MFRIILFYLALLNAALAGWEIASGRWITGALAFFVGILLMAAKILVEIRMESRVP